MTTRGAIFHSLMEDIKRVLSTASGLGFVVTLHQEMKEQHRNTYQALKVDLGRLVALFFKKEQRVPTDEERNLIKDVFQEIPSDLQGYIDQLSSVHSLVEQAEKLKMGY